MDDDFNTPKAIQVMWNFLRDGSAEGKLRTIKKFDEVLGLNLLKTKKDEIPKDVEKLAKERQKYREEKNWKKSDELRKKIESLGYKIEDGKTGAVIIKNDLEIILQPSLSE